MDTKRSYWYRRGCLNRRELLRNGFEFRSKLRDIHEDEKLQTILRMRKTGEK